MSLRRRSIAHPTHSVPGSAAPAAPQRAAGRSTPGCRFLLWLLLALWLPAASGCAARSPAYTVPPDPRGPAELARDEALAETVQARFDREFGPDALDIEPFVYGGTVFLVGQYQSDERKDRAVELAGTTDGEHPVKAYVMLRRDVPGCSEADNADLAQTVAEQLQAAPEEPGAGFRVATVQCTVVFLGLARSPDEVARALEAVRNIKGVRRATSFVRPYRPAP